MKSNIITTEQDILIQKTEAFVRQELEGAEGGS